MGTLALVRMSYFVSLDYNSTHHDISTSRLPVIYVFGKRYIDIDYCADQFLLELGNDLSKAGSSKTIIVKTDVSYAHSIREFYICVAYLLYLTVA